MKIIEITSLKIFPLFKTSKDQNKEIYAVKIFKQNFDTFNLDFRNTEK